MKTRNKIFSTLLALGTTLSLAAIPVLADEEATITKDFDLPVYVLKTEGENYTLTTELTGKFALETDLTVEIGECDAKHFEGLSLDYYWPMADGYGTPSEGYDFVSEFHIDVPATLKNAAGEAVTEEQDLIGIVTFSIPEGYTGEDAFSRYASGEPAGMATVNGDSVTFYGLPMKYKDGKITTSPSDNSGVFLVEWKKASASTTPDVTTPSSETNADVTTPSSETTTVATAADGNAAPNTNANQGGSNGTVPPPQTGDSGNLALWCSILLLSGVALAFTTTRKSKKDN